KAAAAITSAGTGRSTTTKQKTAPIIAPITTVESASVMRWKIPRGHRWFSVRNPMHFGQVAIVCPSDILTPDPEDVQEARRPLCQPEKALRTVEDHGQNCP